MKDFVRFRTAVPLFCGKHGAFAFSKDTSLFFCRKRLFIEGCNLDFLAFSFDNLHKKE